MGQVGLRILEECITALKLKMWASMLTVPLQTRDKLKAAPKPDSTEAKGSYARSSHCLASQTEQRETYPLLLLKRLCVRCQAGELIDYLIQLPVTNLEIRMVCLIL